MVPRRKTRQVGDKAVIWPSPLYRTLHVCTGQIRRTSENDDSIDFDLEVD